MVREQRKIKMLKKYFNQIFTTTNTLTDLSLLEKVDRKVNVEMNTQLTRENTTKKFFNAMSQINSSKAPILNGIALMFYHTY